MGCFIAPADNRKDEYGDGPNRIGLGGFHAVVEVAHSIYLIFIKIFGIIYIQVKKL